MSRNLLIALILIALTVVIFLLNSSGSISINMLVTTVRAPTAMALLGFTGTGVIIGLLLR